MSSSKELAMAGKADVWVSNRILSDQQLHAAYDGPPLESERRYFWQVQVWDADGLLSRSSGVSWWEMALLSPADWTGVWISDGHVLPTTEDQHYEDDPAPLFRKSFHVDRPVQRARLYAVGLGYGEFRLNGGEVSDHVLDPPWTAFASRAHYACHDVTARLVTGENVLGAMLGNGWFNPLPLRMWGRINIRDHLPVGRPQLIAQLVIEYQDGTTETVKSDTTWRTSAGPILRNSVYLGEKYDARLEQSGWDQSGFDDTVWEAVSTGQSDVGELRASPIAPVRVTKRVRPVSVNEVQPNVHIFDLGQNFAGWVSLRVSGPRGTTVEMRMGERIYEDGTLNPMTAVAGQIKGLREDGTPRGGPGSPEVAWQSNTYTLRGGDPEKYTPRFTYHGFRYVEVTGFPGTPTLDAIEGLRLNTDLETSGRFSCSNSRLNQLQEATKWTLLSNVFSVQSDCPAREKFQYGGDIVATSEMAIYNYDMATFYAKTVADHRDAARDGWLTETAPFVGISAASFAPDAGPIGWGLAHPLLVDQLYRYYGDRRLVEEHFATARNWVDLLERNAEGYIVDRCIGDHESLDPKPIELIATAQFYQSALLVAGFAEILGLARETEQYQHLAAKVKAAFVERFLKPGTGEFGIATQAAQATALYMGLVPEAELEAATRHMVSEVEVTHRGHVATGIFGTKYLLEMLSITGNAGVAYGMVDTPDYPGWGFMLERGATTIWETWAESDNVYSQNHPMFGSVSEWFYKSLGGIRPEADAVGFDRFRIEPDTPAGLDWVDVSYESVRGTIRSRWRREGPSLLLDVEIPVNTTAVVRLPTRDPSNVQDHGRPIGEMEGLRAPPVAGPDGVILQLGSGQYAFSLAS